MNSFRVFQNFKYDIFFAFVSLVLVFLGTNWSLNPYDEGIILTGAMRVQDGALIHKDFYANYGPGQFHLISFFYSIFGRHLFSARIADCAVRWLCCIAGLILARRVFQGPTVFLVAYYVSLLLAKWGMPNYPVWACLLFTLAGIIIVSLQPCKQGPRMTLFGAGLLTGCAGYFRYDIAILIAAAHFLAILARGLRNITNSGNRSLKTGLLEFVLFTGALAIPVTPMLLNYWLSGRLGDFVFQVFTFPAGHYHSTRRLPILGCFSTREMIAYLPFLAILAQLAQFLGPSFRTVGEQTTDGLVSRTAAPAQTNTDLFDLLNALCICLIAKGWVRFSQLHLSLAIVLALFSLIHFIRSRMVRGKVSVSTDLVALVSIIVLTVSFWVGLKRVSIEIWSKKALFQQWDLTCNLKNVTRKFESFAQTMLRITQSVTDFSIDPDQRLAAARLRELTGSAEMIFVGNGRHDKIFANDVALYFLAERKPATRWYHFDPGLQTSSEIQHEMIQEIEKSKVQWIVLCDKWTNASEPNASSDSTGCRNFDAYLKLNYTQQETYGMYSLWRHR